MANARTVFDAIAELLQREHEASFVSLYGKPALQLGETPFLFFLQDAAAFRLFGRAHAQALGLAGATAWSPLGEVEPDSPWVRVPAAHFLRWEALAVSAALSAATPQVAGPSAVPSDGPPPEPPAAQRFREQSAQILERASKLRLQR